MQTILQMPFIFMLKIANGNPCNQAMLKSIDNPIYYIKAIDNLQKNVSIQNLTKYKIGIKVRLAECKES